MANTLEAIYAKHPRVLWLEDQETKAYLSKVWEGKNFGYLIGGGAGNVRAAVEAAKQDGFAHVFGIIDRDFRKTNRNKWQQPSRNLRIYTLDAHELENLLLNAVAVEASAENEAARSAAEITQKLETCANKMIWWMAARHVLSETQDEAMNEFPRHPPLSQVTSQQTAEAVILQSTWFTQAANRVLALTAQSQVAQKLATWGLHYQTALNNGTWMHEFSGKELFRTIWGYVYVGRRQQATPLDLVKSVAQWQVDNQLIPAEITELGEAIERRPL